MAEPEPNQIVPHHTVLLVQPKHHVTHHQLASGPEVDAPARLERNRVVAVELS
jgi:hypothetical protein